MRCEAKSDRFSRGGTFLNTKDSERESIWRSRSKQVVIFFGLGLILLLLGCSLSPPSYNYKIALDPAWYSLQLPGRESQITPFTLELIQEIGKIEKLDIGIFERSWNNLIYGLQEGDYDAIFSTLQPYLFYEKLYDFSDLYLKTGPVLVGRANETAKSIDDMVGKIVAIVRGSKTGLVLEKYPGVIQRTYDSAPQALIDITKGTIDGAILDVLTAEAYIKSRFEKQLKIFSAPLTQEGIRLISFKDHASGLIKAFDRGLQRLKANGTYAALAKKWNLEE